MESKGNKYVLNWMILTILLLMTIYINKCGHFIDEEDAIVRKLMGK